MSDEYNVLLESKTCQILYRILRLTENKIRLVLNLMKQIGYGHIFMLD